MEFHAFSLKRISTQECLGRGKGLAYPLVHFLKLTGIIPPHFYPHCRFAACLRLWYPSLRAMKHLLRIRVFLKPYLWQILATLLILLILTGLSLIVPRIIRSVIDDGLARGQRLFPHPLGVPSSGTRAGFRDIKSGQPLLV